MIDKRPEQLMVIVGPPFEEASMLEELKIANDFIYKLKFAANALCSRNNSCRVTVCQEIIKPYEFSNNRPTYKFDEYSLDCVDDCPLKIQDPTLAD
jgi:hypothetical protein